MRLYVRGTTKYYVFTVREWLDDHYGQDISMDIATDYIDGHEYDEIEILELVDWFEEYCGKNALVLEVFYVGRVKNDMN